MIAQRPAVVIRQPREAARACNCLDQPQAMPGLTAPVSCSSWTQAVQHFRGSGGRHASAVRSQGHGRAERGAQQLLRELHVSVSTGGTWRDADTIGAHLRDSIAIAVQRGSGLAIRTSMDNEMRRVSGAAAA